MSPPILLDFKVKNWCSVVYKRFPFNKYPGHVQNLHTYAFKPIAIMETLADHQSVFWLDASVKVTSSNLDAILNIVRETDGISGVFPATYTHNMTHPQMYDFLPTTQSAYRKATMAAAGAMLFLNTVSIFDNVLLWHFACAVTPDCIRPEGATTNCAPKNQEEEYPESSTVSNNTVSTFESISANHVRSDRIENLTRSEQQLPLKNRFLNVTESTNLLSPASDSAHDRKPQHQTFVEKILSLDEDYEKPIVRCHRFDQSSISILIFNYQEKIGRDPLASIYPLFDRYNEIKHNQNKHMILRELGVGSSDSGNMTERHKSDGELPMSLHTAPDRTLKLRLC